MFESMKRVKNKAGLGAILVVEQTLDIPRGASVGSVRISLAFGLTFFSLT